MNKIKIAIVGATGLVGRTILKILEEKELLNYEYVLFSSKKSAGKKVQFLGNTYTVKELTENSFDEGFSYAIFSAGSNISKKYAPIAVQKNCIVIDNSSYFRMNKDVPLIVPEVNLDVIYNHNGIIANPNCSTIQAVVALKPLDVHYGIKRIIYSTYQAVSGAGYKGVFPCPIVSNCIPHIDVFLGNGYTKEEEKMINETRKILNKPNLSITATTVRVPVLNCHSESINVEFEEKFNLKELKEVLKNSPGIILKDNLDINENRMQDCNFELYQNDICYPTVLDANDKDEVFVGRVRRDFSCDSGINLWVVADNLRKGAASNAVQILEKLLVNNFKFFQKMY